MTPAAVPDQLRRYAAAGTDLSRPCWLCFQQSPPGWQAPPAFLAAVRAAGLEASAALEEQGGRPIVICRRRGVPTAEQITACWRLLDGLAEAHGVSPVQLFWLSPPHR